MKEHQGISAMLRTAREALDNKETKETKEEFERLRRRKTQLSNQIDNARDQEKNMVRQVDLERKKSATDGSRSGACHLRHAEW